MNLWTHCGFGVSSRLAERYLVLLEREAIAVFSRDKQDEMKEEKMDGAVHVPNGNGRLSNGHGLTNGNGHADQFDSTEPTHPSFNTSAASDALLSAGTEAKAIIRRRIASFASSDSNAIGADNVFLFPNGMMAVWSAHRLVMESMGEGRSVCFG